MASPRTKAKINDVMIGKTGFIEIVKIGSKDLPAMTDPPILRTSFGSRVLPRK